VLGLLERNGNVRANVIPERTKRIVQEHIRGNVESGSSIYSDEHPVTWRMDGEYTHGMVNHANVYVNGNIYTNGLENSWWVLKRTIGRTYVSVEPFHLFRHLDEPAFRFNNRKPMNDSRRFSYVVLKIVGKRLTHSELIGKTEGSPGMKKGHPSKRGRGKGTAWPCASVRACFRCYLLRFGAQQHAVESPREARR
jgi:hypothetical protein